MIQQLCTMFPALDPIRLRETDAQEVILLIYKVIKSTTSGPPSSTSRKRVYADQVQWF